VNATASLDSASRQIGNRLFSALQGLLSEDTLSEHSFSRGRAGPEIGQKWNKL